MSLRGIDWRLPAASAIGAGHDRKGVLDCLRADGIMPVLRVRLSV